MHRPTLILLVGIPGSGKTTYANKYVEEHFNTIHLSSDKIREELWGNEAVQGDNNEVSSLIQKRAISALHNGQDVVYDATNITRKDRACIIAPCPKFARIEAHIIWAPIETCIERDTARERTVGKTVIDKMLKKFQAPYYDEGIDSISISYPENFDHSKYTEDIFDAMKIPHDNPHHSLNIFEHCKAAGDYVANNDPSGTLLLAAFGHDIGKPYVKSFVDSKGNPCEQAHYYQHQCVGAWMYYGTRAAARNLYDVDVAWLISTHMDPFLNTKYYNRLPAYLKEQVDLLHEADRAAH